jgi:hypothetical protein
MVFFISEGGRAYYYEDQDTVILTYFINQVNIKL